MLTPAPPALIGALGSAEAGSEYLATEAHYRSLAGRITAALSDSGGSLVLVTGDPPADPALLSQALRKTAEARHPVTGLASGTEPRGAEVLRSGSVYAALTGGVGGTAATELPAPKPQLHVIDDVDCLSDSQIGEICEAGRHNAGRARASVMFARPAFLDRLEEPPLRCLKEALAAQFRFEEIGADESIEFLRHQLAARQCLNEARRISPGFLSALAGAAALLVVGASGLLLLYRASGVGEPSPRSAIAMSPPREAPAPPSTPPWSAGALPGEVTTAIEPAPVAAVRAPDPAPRPAHPAQAVPGQNPAAPATTSQAASPQPEQNPASQALSQLEIAALVTRGDDFLRAGDIASARLFYERAADAGNGGAALRLGTTFDPGFLGRAGVRGDPGDPARASSWYRRARELGEAADAERLKNIQRQPFAEPGSSAR